MNIKRNKKVRSFDPEFLKILERSELPNKEVTHVFNERCEYCKNTVEHNGCIVLNLNTGKWVHKNCEYKSGRGW